jgi:hypothetical protein
MLHAVIHREQLDDERDHDAEADDADPEQGGVAAAEQEGRRLPVRLGGVRQANHEHDDRRQFEHEKEVVGAREALALVHVTRDEVDEGCRRRQPRQQEQRPEDRAVPERAGAERREQDACVDAQCGAEADVERADHPARAGARLDGPCVLHDAWHQVAQQLWRMHERRRDERRVHDQEDPCAPRHRRRGLERGVEPPGVALVFEIEEEANMPRLRNTRPISGATDDVNGRSWCRPCQRNRPESTIIPATRPPRNR